MVGRPRTISDAEILAAAGRTISRLGPARTTLAAIASECGLAAATLVQRFGSKRSLLLAFSTHAVESLPETLAAVHAAHTSPLAAIRASLFAMSRGIRTPEELANHLAFLQLELSEPEFHRQTRKHLETMRSHVRQLLEEAIEHGELRACDTARLAQAICVTYNGALTMWAIQRKGTLARCLERELDFLLAPAVRVGCANPSVTLPGCIRGSVRQAGRGGGADLTGSKRQGVGEVVA